jgi:hypothetical protein
MERACWGIIGRGFDNKTYTKYNYFIQKREKIDKNCLFFANFDKKRRL